MTDETKENQNNNSTDNRSSGDNVTPFPGAKGGENTHRTARVLEIANDRSLNGDVSVNEPAIRLPPVIKSLVLSLLLVHVTLSVLTPEALFKTLWQGGFIAGRFTGVLPLDAGAIFSPVTHMFLHGGWVHLLVNVAMLMAFGAGLERHMGAWRFIILYLAAGIAGALLHLLVYPSAEAPLIGASGAISGLFSASVMMLRRAGAMQGSFMPFILIWIGMTLFFGFFGAPGTSADIGWTSHLGGFAAGFVLYHFLTKPVVK